MKPSPTRMHTPPWIAIVGVDGCGKSAVIQRIKQQAEIGMDAEIFVLERSRKSAAAGQPVQNYARPPHSPLLSIGKLCWAAVRWEAEYSRIRHALRGKSALILSDHHYFTGVAIDPLRYRYGGPGSVAKWMSAHLVHPDAFIFLDAPMDVVYARKQEATRHETQALIERYRKWFQQAHNVCIIDASQSLDQVSSQVAGEIVRLLRLFRDVSSQ